MLTKLALKNIRYYVKNYFVYLMTISFSVWAYYMFHAFADGGYLKTMAEFSKVYEYCFATGSWILLIFTAIFIWFSTDFFFQNRKQEFGLYILMGIKKRMVGQLLIIETVVMGMMAVIAGSAIAGLTLEPLKLFVGQFYRTKMDIPVAEYLSIWEMGDMLIRFFMVFLIFSIFHYRNIKKSELTELFSAKQSLEQPLKTSKVLMAGAVVILTAGYVMIFIVRGAVNAFLLPIGLGCVMAGTVFCFMQVTAQYTNQKRNSEKCARDIAARVNVTGMLHCVRRNTGSWASITLLIAISMCSDVLGLAFYRLQREIEHETGMNMKEVSDLYIMILFMFILISIAVLSCTGSMLYFRVMADIQDNQKNYWLLYCIGANRKEMGMVQKRQIITMFAVPMAAGLFHTMMFGIFLKMKHLSVGYQEILAGITVYLGVYLIYMLIAAWQGKGLLQNVYAQRRE